MALVLKKSDSYSWPVTYRQPISGGRRTKQEFQAIFRRLPQSRITEIQEQVQKRLDGEDVAISDVSIADEVLVGWDGVVDDDASSIEFTQSVKEDLLELPLMAGTLVEAYFNSLVEDKRGN